CLALCSPITQRMASDTLVLPQPLGPTTPVIPSPKCTAVRSTNDLKPWISSLWRNIPASLGVRGWRCPARRPPPRRRGCAHHPELPCSDVPRTGRPERGTHRPDLHSGFRFGPPAS